MKSPYGAPVPPELAEQVGYLIVTFTNTEDWLYRAFAQMIDDEDEVTHAILSRVDSFSHKLGVIMDVAEIHASENLLAAALVGVRENIEAAASFRNKVAHGIWGFEHATGESVILFRLYITGRGPMQRIPITPDLLWGHTRKLMDAYEAVRPLLEDDRPLLDRPGLQPSAPRKPSRAKGDGRGRRGRDAPKPRAPPTPDGE